MDNVWEKLKKKRQALEESLPPVVQKMRQNPLDDGPMPPWEEDRPIEPSGVQLDDFVPIPLSVKRTLSGKEKHLASVWKELRKLTYGENARLKEHIAINDWFRKTLGDWKKLPDTGMSSKEFYDRNRSKMLQTRANMETAGKAKDWVGQELLALGRRKNIAHDLYTPQSQEDLIEKMLQRDPDIPLDE